MAKKLKLLNIKCRRIGLQGAIECWGYDANGKLVLEADMIVFKEEK